MPKKTVLEIVQDVLSDMNSDEVNSINDTTESIEVANIVRSTYEDIIALRDWPHLQQMFLLDSAVSATPTHMSLPDNIVEVLYIKYDKRTDNSGKKIYKTIDYVEPDVFLARTEGRDSTDSTVDTVTDPSGSTLLIKNDAHPSYYTSFDDEYLVFDAYDSSLETNLQNSKSQGYGIVEPTFTLTDTFTPDLPAKSFPYFIAEVKSTCFNTIKQAPNAKEEQKSRRQKRKISRDARRSLGGGVKYPDYGRASKK